MEFLRDVYFEEIFRKTGTFERYLLKRRISFVVEQRQKKLYHESVTMRLNNYMLYIDILGILELNSL